MLYNHHRYFIELEPDGGVSRANEVTARRAQALHFIHSIYIWLKDHALHAKVADIDVTALGQIRITCEADVIHHLRTDDILPIAIIRPGAMFMEGMNRNLGGRR
jgi:hypothetical protein